MVVMGGYRVLLFIVVLLGLVLIYGYTHLTLKTQTPTSSSTPKDDHFDHYENQQAEVIFKFKRISFGDSRVSSTVSEKLVLPKGPSSKKIANITKKPKDNSSNRTAEAANQNVVVFNRVPKTGSEMFEHFGKLLSSVLGYHIYIDPQIFDLFPDEEKSRYFASNFAKNVTDTGIYFRHMTYVDFKTYGIPQPIYVSIVRHPIDRMVSWYYYLRWRNREDDVQPKEVCAKSAKWRAFCKMMEKTRNKELNKSQDWFDMDFNDCVKNKHPECVYNDGDGHLLQNKAEYDFRNQMMFFCGNKPECALFNSELVLNQAKETVEKKYAVVGVLEDIKATFTALQHYVPKFFHGALQLYKEHLSNETLTHTNKNPNKKPLEANVRKYLETKFDKEIEFFEFCQQRLYRQNEAAKNAKIDELQQESEWPSQLGDNPAILVDDYVLL